MAQTSMADMLVRRSISGAWADKPKTANTAATGSVYTDDWVGRTNRSFAKTAVSAGAREGGVTAVPTPLPAAAACGRAQPAGSGPDERLRPRRGRLYGMDHVPRV
jgi:hypothetical protein